jgi:hypothetical protein
MFYVVLLFGSVAFLSVILSAVFDGKRAGKIFEKILFASFIGLCSVGIIMMLTIAVGGLIMLCNS